MPTVRKRAGRWRVEVKRTLQGPDGPVQRRWSQTLNTKTAATRWGLELEDIIDSGGNPDAPDLRAELLPPVTVSQWHRRWWAARIAEPSTLAANESRLRVHVLPRWGHLPLDQVRPLEVQAWVKQLQKDGMGAATISSCHQLLRRMMTAAVKEGLLPVDPCAHTTLPTIPKGRETYWSRDEVDRIVGHIDDRQARLVVLTLAYTGLRWGELTGLQVGELDLLRRRLKVARVWTRHGWKDYPKSAAGRRVVPIPAWLCEELAAHLGANAGSGWEPHGPFAHPRPTCTSDASTTPPAHLSRVGAPPTRRAPADRSALVFATSAGTPLSGHNFRSRIWVPALDAAEVQRGALHDLRHSYASWLVQEGRTLEEVKALLGHKSIRTSERYGHLRPDHGFDAVSVLERPDDHAASVRLGS